MLNPTLVVAQTPEDYQEAKKLFQEYAENLGVDLCFQNFQTELEQITQQYNAQDGGILLLKLDNEPIACVGLRKIDSQTAELKRMYIRANYRGQGWGRMLLQAMIKIAQSLDYQYIRLDTLLSMTEAFKLYQSLGFYEIEAYRHNPLGGTKYMELKL